jgi:hypothetical protein
MAVGTGRWRPIGGTIVRVTPTTSAPGAPAPAPRAAEPTHPCIRCGAPVGPDVGLCERCNPLGLRDVAAGQVHGSVFIAVAVAIAVLAVVARLSVSGLGPFPATVDAVATQGSGLAVTLTVTNQGTSTGRTTCRISRANDKAVTTSAFVTSPQLAPKETRTFTSVVTQFGSQPAEFAIECRQP